MAFTDIGYKVIVTLCFTILLAEAADFTKITKAENEYGEMCGCKHIFYKNQFNASDDHFSGYVASSTIAYNGQCDKISTTRNTFSELVIPDDIIDCFMKGKIARLSGHFFTEAKKYCRITAEYQLDNQTEWRNMELKALAGAPFWKKFDYYFDFADYPDLNHLKLKVQSPIDLKADASQDVVYPIYLDEFKICKFCDGNVENPLPALQKIEVNTGTLVTLSDNNYLLNVAAGTSTVQVKPTLDSRFPGSTIKVNNVTVGSGAFSSPITLNTDPDKSTYIYLEVVRSTCERNIYTIEVKIPEGPDATLFSLKTSIGTISPVFYRFVNNYTLAVQYLTSTIELTPIANDPKATITVNGIPVESGEESNSIDVTTNHTITILVTARDHVTTKAYSINVVNKFSMVIYVDYDALCPGECDGGSWPKAYHNLEDALLKAKAHPIFDCEIWIAAGNYTATSYYNIDFGVKIYGGFPSDGGTWEERNTTINNTNLRSSSTYQIIRIQTSKPVILDGLNITQSAGNGLTLNSSQEVKIVDCEISHNTGSGIFSFYCNTLHFEKCNIANNGDGGLVINQCSNSLICKNSYISENYSNSEGGGVDLGGCTGNIWFSNCNIERNSTTGKGGGLYVQTNTILGMVNCRISENMANDGGGIYNDGMLTTELQIINCLIAGNKAVDISAGGHGGGIYSSGKKLRATNCTFVENVADVSGGGIYYNEGYGWDHYILNTIFWNNKIPGYIPPMSPLADISQLATNSLNPVNINFSCIQDKCENDGDIYPAPLSETNKNFDLDPKFTLNGFWDVGYNVWSSGNYTLTNLSSCLENGDLRFDLLRDLTDVDNDGIINEVIPIDRDGNPRLIDSDSNGIKDIDVGAFEFGP